MNRFKSSACKLRARGNWRLATAYVLVLIPVFSASVADEVDDQTVLALVNVPAQNLPCDQAAAQASVSFQARKVPFAVRRISVFLDGAGLPESAVDLAWPSVVVSQGLHPGRNLVELILYGPDNQSMDRKQSVLIGTQPGYGDVAPAQIDCLDASTADDQAAFPVSAIDGSDEAPADAAPLFDDAGPAYVEGPVYSYYPAPVFFGPVYSSGYFLPPPVYYSPRAPFYDGHRGHRPDRDRGGSGSGEHAADPPSAGRPSSVPAFGDGAYLRPGSPNSGHPGADVPAAHHGTFNTYTAPSYGRSGTAESTDGHSVAAPSPQPQGGNAYRGVTPLSDQRRLGTTPAYGSRPETPPQALPPPSRQLAPPQQLPLPSNRFSTPPAVRGGATTEPQPRR